MSVFYTDFIWQGQEYWLKFNFDAMKSFGKKYPDIDYTSEIVTNYAENMEMACEIAAELMAQGEKIRRHWGYPGRRIPDSEELKTISTPADYVEMVVALIQELIHGNGRTDKQENEEYDPWLLEAEKKKNYLASLNGQTSA